MIYISRDDNFFSHLEIPTETASFGVSSLDIFPSGDGNGDKNSFEVNLGAKEIMISTRGRSYIVKYIKIPLI